MKAWDWGENLKIGLSLIYYLIREAGRVVLRLLGATADLTVLYYHGIKAECRSNFPNRWKHAVEGRGFCVSRFL